MAGADRSTLIHLAILLVRLPALPAASVAAGHCVSTEFPGVGFPWRVGGVRESLPDLASAVVLWLPLVHASAFKDSLRMHHLVFPLPDGVYIRGVHNVDMSRGAGAELSSAPFPQDGIRSLRGC